LQLFQKLVLYLGLFQLLIVSGFAQDYLWPTDASRNLTSSFAEYRPGHFHAGIDIKTWGQIGYKVFAIRDGYIMRISVSPFGYGKVLYQRLDTGEIVVFAHLDRFTKNLQDYVKQEQKRQGEYRINKYLARDQFPVKQGEVIGYTGASGIGYPHLHFEVRDKNNNPINPLLLGYKIDDTIPPNVKAICITPLDFFSRVNADVLPFIERPIRGTNGNYVLRFKPVVSGKIGFSVECFDRADGTNNNFAVYKIDFYINGNLKFSAKYDRFSYSVTHMIDLDRDYRLMNRRIGRFQKLYKEKFNKLSFYKPIASEIGILNCDPSSTGNLEIQNQLGKGEHQFRIELYDFFGNYSTVTGNFIVAEQKKINANFHFEESNQLYISEICDQNGNEILNPDLSVSLDQGISWRKMKLYLPESESGIDNSFVNEFLLKPIVPSMIVKIHSMDENDIPFLPAYHVAGKNLLSTDNETEINLEKDFYDDYVRLKLKLDGTVQKTPLLTIQQIGIPSAEVPLLQTNFDEFIGIYQIVPGKDGPMSVEVTAFDPMGRELVFWEQFDIQTVSPNGGGRIISKDSKCRVSFGNDAVYKNMFLRLNQLGPLDNWTYDFVGEVYELFPRDIPFKKSARIELQYPESDSLPDKLGIYRINSSKPGFSGNQLNYQNNTISCNVSNLGAFTLIRDIVLPNVSIKRPRNNAVINSSQLSFIAVVDDQLSGIASERSIIMKLDGEVVIAEYDPEEKTIKYQPDTPLLAGEHTITVSAEDNSENETTVTHKFYIVK